MNAIYQQPRPGFPHHIRYHTCTTHSNIHFGNVDVVAVSLQNLVVYDSISRFVAGVCDNDRPTPSASLCAVAPGLGA